MPSKCPQFGRRDRRTKRTVIEAEARSCPQPRTLTEFSPDPQRWPRTECASTNLCQMGSEEWLQSGRGDYLPQGWESVTRGVRVPEGASEPQRLRAWLAALPEPAALTHVTAAKLRGWWLPPLPEAIPVTVAVPHEVRVRRAGLRTIRCRGPVAIEMVEGLPVEPVAATLSRCARDLSPLDMLCLADAARVGGAEGLALEPSGTWGAARTRLAVALSHCVAESIWEVLLREFHRVVEVDVVPQLDVCDDDGQLLGRADLWLVGTKTIHEYDGGQHRTPEQHRADLRRDRRLMAAGWQRRGYTSGDLLHRPYSILRDIDLTLGRPSDPGRIAAWNDLLRASTFTPEGRVKLARRLKIAGG